MAGCLMTKSDHATEQFRSGLNCAQAVFGEYAEELGVDVDFALATACGFGGGMGRLGHACGAVTGAVMVIGLKACTANPREPGAKIRAYDLVRSFVEEFEARNGTIGCRKLLDCDLSTPEGYGEAAARGLFQSRCPTYVRDAVEILEQMF